MIKRYYATKDNTITNAYAEGLVQTGEDANMGASDILEVFTIYGQTQDPVTETYSLEEARILIEFDITQIQADIDAERVPDDAQYFLRLFNAEHGRTLPENFTLEVSQVEVPWEEGTGLDMEDYKDKPYGVGSSWLQASGQKAKATATIPLSDPNIELTATSTGRSMNGRRLQIDVLPDSGSDYVVDFTEIGPQGGIDQWTKVDITNPTLGQKITSAELVELINTGAIAGKPNLTINDPNNLRTLQTATGGGSTEMPDAGTDDLAFGDFSGGEGEWATPGGDFTGTPSTFTFDKGTEDLVINVTSFVSNWLSDPTSSNGLIVKFPDEVQGQSRSYYTKMFFARGTSNFFKKPTLEARWSSQVTDNRTSFYSGESNDIYFYNIFRNQLSSLTEPVTVSLYEELGGTLLETQTATKEETGIYKATVSPTTSLETIYDVWSENGVEIHSGTIEVLQRGYQTTPSIHNLVVSVLNKQSSHSTFGTSRFHFYIRDRDWSPSIHTVATSRPNSKVYDNLHYSISRVASDEVIFDYDFETNSTLTSYDSNGNFFDLDISMLEPNYVYEIKLALFNVMTKSHQELPFKHRFRVVDNEY
jgi:hypothetical protein